MVFWKIKFGKKKINMFKGVCMFMLTESVNKSFLLVLFYDCGNSVSRWWKKVYRVFLLNVIRGHLLLGHEIWLWKKRNLPDRVSAIALLALWLAP